MKRIKLPAIIALLAIFLLAACDSGATPTLPAPTALNPSPTPASVAQAATPTALAPAAPATGVTSPTLAFPTLVVTPTLPSAQPTATLVITPTATAAPAAPQNDTLQPTDIQVPAAYSNFKPNSQISLPAGFKISLFAAGLAKPRMMAMASNGDLFVADMGAGQVVVLPDRNNDGVADSVSVFASGLDSPHSLVFYNNYLYVATSSKVVRYPYQSGDLKASAAATLVTSDFPPGVQDHVTRTIAISPDGKQLYLAAGSDCNVCEESISGLAAITVFDLSADGSKATNGRIFASGIRNAVGIEFASGTSNLWAVVNNRDELGDDVPSETLLRVKSGDNYGWPYCYTQGGKVVYDSNFGQKDASACQNVTTAALEMQAHSAPLGLDFYTGKQFPANYQGNLFIGYHGSWNRSVPTGAKVVRVPFVNGQPQQAIDFATGWLQNGNHWGRPVDPLTAPDGSLFVSDDQAGAVYRIYYQP